MSEIRGDKWSITSVEAIGTDAVEMEFRPNHNGAPDFHGHGRPMRLGLDAAQRLYESLGDALTDARHARQRVRDEDARKAVKAA